MYVKGLQSSCHAKYGTVLAQQPGLVRHRQVDEFLVIGVAAPQARSGCLIELPQNLIGAELLARQPAHAGRVAQHTHQLVAHGRSGQPPDLLCGQGLLERLRTGVVKDQDIEHDVGVENDRNRVRAHVAGQLGVDHLQKNWGRITGSAAEVCSDPYFSVDSMFSTLFPATISKRNRRHSIGPFHIGTRRDSFKRILPGNLRSGERTHAVQPA